MNLSVVLFISILAAFLAAHIAVKRGRNPYFWFGLGFLFGILGIVAIFIAPAAKKEEPLQQTIEPQPYIDGPLDRFWFYLDQMQKQKGPMSHDALTRAWKSGDIISSTLVWHENLTNWTQLQDLIKFKN